MKIRNGFVSNSSSSSFIVAYKKKTGCCCPTCGAKDYDIDQMITNSNNGHYIIRTGKTKVIADIENNYVETKARIDALIEKVKNIPDDWEIITCEINNHDEEIMNAIQYSKDVKVLYSGDIYEN